MSLGSGIPGFSAVYIRDEMAALAAALLYFFPRWASDWTKTEVRVHVTEDSDLVIPRPQAHEVAEQWRGARL